MTNPDSNGLFGTSGGSGYGSSGQGNSQWGSTPPPGNASFGSSPQYQQAYSAQQPNGLAQPEKKSGSKLGAVTIAALMLGSAAVGGVAGALVTDGGGFATTATGSRGGNNALDEPGAKRTEPPAPGSIEEVAQKVLPSVVSIQVNSMAGQESGSGSILSSDGLVLTNNHVVASAEKPGSEMTVLLSDGSWHPATVVAGDAATDIAVIRVEGVRDLRPISLGESDSVSVGQEVIAVGSPLGLTSTVTSGIVSAKNRPVAAGQGGETSVIDAIQTDAAINPGNSGGALVDMEGNLIGVPSVIASNSAEGQQAGSIGLGFAIPINQARRIADELIENGRVVMPAIQAQIDTQAPVMGALVREVTPGGAAERAGLKSGDVIVKFGDRTIDNGIALIAAIRSHKVGDTVTLTVTDENGEHERTADVTLDPARG
ncbi:MULTISPECIES: S1C family serine protease [unclassified Corynebacterium]|uniref:S1C family serine protease n=1 Tax=unclassified Corynebacterium TaxID=2624378 RepID=UPI00309C3D07